MNDDAAMLGPAAPPDFQEAPVLPCLHIGAARAMYVGPGLQLAPHRNTAVTLALALQAPFTWRRWARGCWSGWQPAQAALIPSGTLHHLSSAGAMAFLYLDPHTDGLPALQPETLEAGRRHLLRASPGWGLDAAFAALGMPPRAPRDARLAAVIQALAARPQDFARLQDAARLACLSPSRLRARFQAELGIPFRRYRLWRRMAVVMRALAAGDTLTAAALEAGFADSAHLSTSFRQMFGLAPRALMATGLRIHIAPDAGGPVLDATAPRATAGPSAASRRR